MSFDSRTVNDKSNKSVVTHHHHDTHGEPFGHYISTVSINMRQLQTDLHEQHQHDKGALIELNKSFQVFVDRVQHLQSQNTKYREAIAHFRHQSSGIDGIDARWGEGYLAIYHDLSMVRNAKVDYKWDFEWYQLQIAIYKELIAIEHQWKDKRSSILEEELKQSAAVLHGLRTSYAEVQQKVHKFHAECDDLLKQHMTLTHDWCIVKKQGNKLDISVETLKSYILFYKNLHSYTRKDFHSSSIESIDVKQFGTLELDKIVKKIHRDFEAYYATIYREMAASYEKKIAEIEPDIKQALHYQQFEMEEFAMLLQTQQMEYNEVQKNLSYEKELHHKIEATYSKLEAELQSIQHQHEDRFHAQSKDINDLQESLLLISFDVDEIRRSKANLEAEIIVYRHLLDANRIEERVVTVPHRTEERVVTVPHRTEERVVTVPHRKEERVVTVPHRTEERVVTVPHRTEERAVTVPHQTEERVVTFPHTHTVHSGTTGNLVVKSQKKGSIGIKECAPNGTYISLLNHSTHKSIDISGWILKRDIDSATKVRYTIPDGVRFKRGSELRIYTKSSGGKTDESSSYQKLVNNDIVSWGTGNTIQTLLFNKNGDEEASFSQSIKFQ